MSSAPLRLSLLAACSIALALPAFAQSSGGSSSGGSNASGSSSSPGGTAAPAPILPDAAAVPGSPATQSAAPGAAPAGTTAAGTTGPQDQPQQGTAATQSGGVVGSAGEAAQRRADPRCNDVLARKDDFTASVVQNCQAQTGQQTGSAAGQRELPTGSLGAGIKPIDRPAEVQRSKEPSDQKALNGICSNC